MIGAFHKFVFRILDTCINHNQQALGIPISIDILSNRGILICLVQFQSRDMETLIEIFIARMRMNQWRKQLQHCQHDNKGFTDNEYHR